MTCLNNVYQHLYIVLYGILAQLGEHLPYKQRVTGSSPVGPIKLYQNDISYADVAQLAEQLICNQQVIGSSPIWVVVLQYASDVLWGLSSAGRASALQAEGHRFEPYRPHFHCIMSYFIIQCRCGSIGRAADL